MGSNLNFPKISKTFIGIHLGITDVHSLSNVDSNEYIDLKIKIRKKKWLAKVKNLIGYFI